MAIDFYIYNYKITEFFILPAFSLWVQDLYMELVAVALPKGYKLLELTLAILYFLRKHRHIHNLKKNEIIIFNLPLPYCKISE